MDKITEIAKMIDHSLLHPAFTDNELKNGCELALKYNVASVCIKPYAVTLAVDILKESDVLVGTVIGFPHGNSTIDVKAFETGQAITQGAVEIDMVINIGKVLGKDWAYIEQEINTIVRITKTNQAILKVIFENDYLPDDMLKIRLCELCSAANVDFVKTSTGYGFNKDADGKYSYHGATDADLILMRKHSTANVQVKAAGGIRTLEDVLRIKALGVTRVGATATATILEAAKQQFK